MNRLLLYCDEQIRIAAWFESRHLTDILFESTEGAGAGAGVPGRFYLAKVKDAVPSLDAFFLDAGLDRPVFLKRTDMRVRSAASVGDWFLIQLVSEARESKGARATLHYVLDGQYYLYLPGADYVTASKKISDSDIRARELAFVSNEKRPGEGWVIRSLAVEANGRQKQREMNRLREEWSQLTERYHHELRTGAAKTPGLLNTPNVFWRRVKSHFANRPIDRIDVAWSGTEGEVAEAFFATDEHSLFFRLWRERVLLNQTQITRARENLRVQLGKWRREKVWMRNGGYLYVEQTRTLTVIDVNSGKSTQNPDVSENAHSINVAAAATIARLLRLRGIGGMVIVDFIHIESDEQRLDVQTILQTACAWDECKVTVAGWTNLGMLELTRKHRSITPLNDWLNHP